MSMFIGAAWAYMVVVAILLKPFNYSQKDIGYVSIVYCATGTIGGTIASLYIDYQLKLNIKPNYDILNKAFMTIGMVGILIKALLIDYVNDTWIIIFSGAIGFGLNSFLPLAIQCYVEKMFPCFELVLTTVMMQVSNLLGFILNYILFLDVFKDCGLWVILIVLGPFYIYIIFFFKTKFRRFESEQNKT
ncbi:unnamed protein product [Paramecium sonneborni]|uniref:Uncharacterized protein n=1 Tax=Paramecium sonneborni TaxID=65129 RepID=A0A8S1L0Q9_9CILI|nr:unnamed protein product [Paramecium sonneborni]